MATETSTDWTFTVRANANLEKIKTDLETKGLAFALSERPPEQMGKTKFEGTPSTFWIHLPSKKSKRQMTELLPKSKGLSIVADTNTMTVQFNLSKRLYVSETFPSEKFEEKYIKDAKKGTAPSIQIQDIIEKKDFTNYYALAKYVRSNHPFLYDTLKNGSGHFNNILRDSENQAFEDFINNVYAPYFATTVQDSTAYTAKAHFKRMGDYFKRKSINKLTRLDCSDFRMYLLKKYPGNDPRPTASNYAGAVWTRFKAALSYAYDMKIIVEHPAAGIKTPSKEHLDEPFWTFADFKKAISIFDLKKFHDQWHFTIVWLYYFIGSRVSEGVVLLWRDVDLDNGILKISKTMSQDKNGRLTVHNHTKTHAGMRTIDLDTQTVEILRRWKATQPNQSEDGYILGESATTAVSKTTINRLLKATAKKADVTHITGKGLRSSHASYLINELHETNIKYIQQRLGHEKIQTTLDYYAKFDTSDAMRNEKRKNMDRSIYNAGLQVFSEIQTLQESAKKSAKPKLVS
ncbi:tyrosine-type recombinase/integrase [Lactococcus hircilactis]|uniref:Tyrosine-type recombinase/integrase n=1 Tax=Lactococcus hircilactis TaxID=1494462 RepID=A0A7X1Z7J0_9LACT|nr:site-specific integrase [Lactococcus hircilactis]MQW39221.1 tyrosine-type recombinase/integrase [Lactococcus hircilactis]